MDCAFCSEFFESERHSSREIWRNDQFAIVPTRGCFVPGYSLLCPIDHFRSVAAIPLNILESVELLIEDLRDKISTEFQLPVIVAEHGPGLKFHDRGASCCDHAHVHFIPVPDADSVKTRFLSDAGMATVLTCVADLRGYQDNSYVYLSQKKGQHMVWSAGVLPRQYVRRVCADLIGKSDYYDWRLFPFLENLSETRDRMRERFASPRLPNNENRCA